MKTTALDFLSDKMRPTIDYKSVLNDEQYQAVTSAEGACLVLAGAGSGKTRALVYRAAYLMDRGVDPYQLIVMTFTNKAAKNMLSRLENLLGVKQDRFICGTFHHSANLMLRIFSEEIGFGRNFMILDEQDSLELINLCIKSLNMDKSSKKIFSSQIVRSIISFSRNSMQSIEKTVSEKYQHLEEFVEKIKTVAKLYMTKKIESQVMDYDDLLVNWLWILRNSQKAKEYHLDRFKYILVDEYQDTNRLQHELISILATDHKNIFVVGDDAQSIYSFRGADVRNILEFPKLFANANVFRLQTNYRSTPQILDLANFLIMNNKHKYEKVLKSVRENAQKPILARVNDAYAQGGFIIDRILELKQKGVGFRNMAVLFRAQYQAVELELELSKRGIPYVFRGGMRFFEQAHVKDVLSFLRILVNPKDEISWKRILNMFDGVGSATSDEIWDKLISKTSSLEEVFNEDSYGMLSNRAKKVIPLIQNIITPLLDCYRLGEYNCSDLVDLVVNNWYKEYVLAVFENASERMADIDELIKFVYKIPSLENLISDISLNENFKSEGSDYSDGNDFLVLSTIHQAKGLEWHAVFIIGLYEGGFPHPKALEDAWQMEEERRLFYVAVTRAEEELYLLHPVFRFDRYLGQIITRPSKFLKELRPDICDVWDLCDNDNGTMSRNEMEFYV